jgi:hypothetical protein
MENRILSNLQIFKRLFVILLTLSFAFDTFAQQHLEPTSQVLREYLFPLLYTGFSEKPEAKYTVIPSFSAEYALSVEQKSNRYYLLSNTLSRHQETNKVNVISNSFEIDATLYQAIVELFNTATAQIKEIEREQRIVSKVIIHDTIGNIVTTDTIVAVDVVTWIKVDGTTHYFATTDSTGNTITGETWSPDKNTFMDRLVKISDDLCALSSKDSENKISSSEIEKRINLLIFDMKNYTFQLLSGKIGFK